MVVSNLDGGKSKHSLLPSLHFGERPLLALYVPNRRRRPPARPLQPTPQRLGIRCTMPVVLAISKLTLCVLGVGHRPAKPLNELRCRMAAEMFWTDVLVEQHRGVRSCPLVGRHKDSGHSSPQYPIDAIRRSAQIGTGLTALLARRTKRPHSAPRSEVRKASRHILLMTSPPLGLNLTARRRHDRAPQDLRELPDDPDSAASDQLPMPEEVSLSRAPRAPTNQVDRDG